MTFVNWLYTANTLSHSDHFGHFSFLYHRLHKSYVHVFLFFKITHSIVSNSTSLVILTVIHMRDSKQYVHTLGC